MWVALFVLLWSTSAWAVPTLVCQRPDGGLSIVHWQTEDRTVPDSVDGFVCEEVDSEHFPGTREQRYAWALKDGKIVIDPDIPDPFKSSVDLPIEGFTTAAGGGLAALAGQGFVIRLRKKRT